MNNGNGEYNDFVGLVLNGFPRSVIDAVVYNYDDVQEAALVSREFTLSSDINEELLDCGK